MKDTEKNTTKKSSKKTKDAAERVTEAWGKYDEAGIAKINAFCEGYKDFISNNKTERECASAIIARAEKRRRNCLPTRFRITE